MERERENTERLSLTISELVYAHVGVRIHRRAIT